jgi:Spermidine/putrescine-binding periplasmic protein
MVQELGYVNLTWSGDGVWAIDEAAELGVELRYALPKEGFTVWFDGWVIPKYTKNTKAANYWINFMKPSRHRHPQRRRDRLRVRQRRS